MYPIICKIGQVTVYSYGLMLVIAFAAASGLACRYAKLKGINPDIVFNLLFVGFIFGIIGARAFYVFENLGYYKNNPLEIIMLNKGGLSWFGGLILGIGAGLAYLKKKKLAILKMLDLIIPFVALAQAIGRIGCLLNGCCFGKNAGFGIYFHVHNAVLIPTQLYSSLILVLIFIILRFIQDRPHKQGQVFFTYLLLYSIKRFSIEFLRADNPVIFLGLTLFQLMSIFIFCVAVAKLILIKSDN